MKHDLAHRALHNVILCSPRLVAPLALITVRSTEGGTMAVEGARIGVPDGIPLERLGHMVAEGIVHVVLGHPMHLAGAKADDEGAALQAAYRVRACRIIADCAGMPSGMFSGDAAVNALTSALQARGVATSDRAVDDLHRDILAAMADDGVTRLVEDIAVVVRAGEIPGDVRGLVALGGARAKAMRGHPDLVLALAPLVGDAVVADPTMAASASAVFDLMDVPSTIGEAKEAFALARAGTALPVPRDIVASAVLEMLLKRLKGLGVRGSELVSAFREEAIANAELSLSEKPIIDL